MEKDTKRRNATTLPQGAITEISDGDRLLRAITETALDIVYSEDEFLAFLRKLPSANATATMDRTARILHLHRSDLWRFLVSKNWWNVEPRDGERYDNGLNLMTEILRRAVQSQCVGARDVFVAVGFAPLAAYLVDEAVHHPMSLKIFLDRMFNALAEKEEVSLNETFKILDPGIFVRAIGVANTKSRILNPLAERFRWEMEDVRPSGGSTTQPYPPLAGSAPLATAPETPQHNTSLAADILARKPSNPRMRALQKIASKFPTPSVPPESKEERHEDVIPLVTQKIPEKR